MEKKRLPGLGFLAGLAGAAFFLSRKPEEFELEWSEHALEELPFGVTPEYVEKALREKRLRRRGREKGEYEIICVSHGRFLFLVVMKKEHGFKVKTIRYATDKEKDLYRKAFG